MTTTKTKPRRIMRSFKLDEISAVDSPAQKPALAAIMKRDGAEPAAIAQALAQALTADLGAIAKGDGDGAKTFAEVIAASIERRKAYEVTEKLWPLFDAVQDSIRSIACDGNLSPAGKIAAVRVSIDQFAEAVRGEFPELADEIGKALSDPALGEIISAVRAPGGEPVGKKETPMTDQNTKTVADLEAQIATLKSDNETLAKKVGELETAAAAADLAKNDESFEVDGVTIRKSEVGAGPFALLRKQQDAIEVAAFEKRAEAEIPFLPGEPLAKAQALRAVSRLPEAVRTSIETMLKAGSAAIGTKTAPLGQDGDPPLAKASDELDRMAKAYASEHKVTVEKAMDEVLKTAEGKKLYARQRGRAA